MTKEISWPGIVAGVTLSGLAVFGGSKYDAHKLIVEGFKDSQSEASRYYDKLTGNNEPQLVKSASKENTLSSEIVEKLRQNLVRVEVRPRPPYKPHSKGFDCSGIIMRTLDNQPFVLTAQHCIPWEIVSELNGQTYSTRVEDDLSMFNATIINAYGNVYQPESYFYQDTSGHIAHDVLKIKLLGAEEIYTLPISINTTEPNVLETYYLVRLSSENEMLTYPVKYHDSLSQGRVHRFVSTKTENPCPHGASGSVIVNSSGQIVSVVSRNWPESVEHENVEPLGIDPIDIYSDLCIGPSATQILRLTE